MNFYTVAIEGMSELLADIGNPMASFKRTLYTDAFKKYYEKNLAAFEALENGYKAAIDKEQFINNMAHAVADPAENNINETDKKGAKETLLLDYNVCLAVYVFPSILEFDGESSKILAENIQEIWKEKFPKTNVQISTFENINKGFKRKFCYITTAVCETFHKPDDCYELNLLRQYRDSYLMSQEDGEEIVQEYYNLAPTIVKHINKNKGKKKIYADIWETYLQPCISMIEDGKNEECKVLYTQMVRQLQSQYFMQ